MSRTIGLSANTSWYLFNFRRSTITGLLKSGYEVVCFAPLDQWSSELENLGSRFVEVRMDAAGVNPLLELLFCSRVLRLLRRERPVYLFNFTIKMNLYFGLAARILGIPYANNISGLGTAFIHDSFPLRLARRFYGVANQGAQTVFFQNPDDRDLFVRRGLVDPHKLKLLPGSGVNTHRFAYSPLVRTSPTTFLMISRLIGDKGVREFVAAARQVKSLHPDTRFVLVGNNNVMNRTAVSDDEIAAWRDEGVVELPGEQVDVRPWLKECHIFVLPSYREGMPRTVLEAAAIGRPSIVSDVTGCRHAIVPSETGWLCEVRSADSLALTMLEALAEKDLAAWGLRARGRVEERFAEEIVVQAYMDSLSFLETGNN